MLKMDVQGAELLNTQKLVNGGRDPHHGLVALMWRSCKARRLLVSPSDAVVALPPSKLVSLTKPPLPSSCENTENIQN